MVVYHHINFLYVFMDKYNILNLLKLKNIYMYDYLYYFRKILAETPVITY